MKRILALLLALTVVLSLASCGSGGSGSAPAGSSSAPAQSQPPAESQPAEAPGDSGAAAPVAEEVKGVTVPAFAVMINGVAVDQNAMAAYPMYSVQATSVNSSGTESTITYVGFAVKDLLDAAGLSESYVWLEAAAGDGYTVSFSDAALIGADTTLLAMTKDGSPFDAAPWFAPCTDQTTGNYLKGCVSILVNTAEGKPDGLEHGSAPAADAGDEASGELPEILDRTDKVEFAAFSFLVNGQAVTNETLAGLSIYKIDAVSVNSAGESSTSGYTGYRLADVLEACGVTGAAKVTAVANDGYENELTPELIGSEYTLVAIEKDKETGEDGTIWLAPCSETSSKSYAKLVVEIKAE